MKNTKNQAKACLEDEHEWGEVGDGFTRIIMN
jgi:hypothetical protein